MKQYQYKVIRHLGGKAYEEDWLNEQGKEGWTLTYRTEDKHYYFVKELEPMVSPSHTTQNRPSIYV